MLNNYFYRGTLTKIIPNLFLPLCLKTNKRQQKLVKIRYKTQKLIENTQIMIAFIHF